MIPLKLHLKNFLSYGPELQEIDFSPYQLICLSGKNGHGKSALLDAITWALWGQARKPFGTAKADENLVRLGETQMLVIFDFTFNGQTYRIRREFAKTYGKPYAVLEFGILDTDKESLVPLTDKTIRATQEKIEKLLNLDIESFVNSAFLRQGQANEFSKKSAKERKTVLATILGLNRYDIIKTLANEKVKEASLQKLNLLAVQERRTNELQQKSILTTTIDQLAAKLTALQEREQALITHKTSLDTQRQQLAKQQQEQQLLMFRQDQHIKQEQELLQEFQTLTAQWRSIAKKLRGVTDIAQLEERKRALVLAVQQHQQALQQSLELKEQLLHAKEKGATVARTVQEQHAHKVQAARSAHERLQFEQNALTSKHKEITALAAQQQTQTKELAQALQAIVTRKAALEQQLKPYAQLQLQFEKRKEYYQQFGLQGSWTKQSLDALVQKQTLVSDDDNPSCPLCEQNLSATRKKFLKHHFDTDQQFLSHRITRLKRVTTALKQILIEQHAQLQQLQQAVQEKERLASQEKEYVKQQELLVQRSAELAAQLDANRTASTQLAATMVEQQKALEQLQQQAEKLLLEHTEYQSVARTITDIEQRIKEIAYNQPQHLVTQQQLQTVEQQLAEHTHLQAQAAQQEQRQVSAHELATRIKQLRANQRLLAQQLAQFANLQQQLLDLTAQNNQQDNQQQALRVERETLLQEKGSLETQQSKLADVEREFQEQLKVITQLDETIDDYQTIAGATGKDGIQALLIEEAIPEIEQEANQLLAKLTNNQAQIFIESLRDLKKGGTKETLDIKISDSIGIRPYELFSGGEAFRIDFALRIAISKLLARRAGTSLQTLIIDEGFGSQDEEGLQHIMDAIYKIQEDFAKVIIVSHLPFMKDQFPVHFVVEKGPNGSSVKVMEQG